MIQMTFNFLLYNKKKLVLLVLVTMVDRGSTCIYPGVVKSRPGRFTSEEEIPVPSEQVGLWTLEPVWTFRRK